MNFQATIEKGVIRILPQQAGSFVVFASRFKPDQLFDLTIEKQTKRRTLPQNRRMWKIMQVFEALGWEKNEAKEWMCGEFLEPVVRELPDGTRIETTRGTRNLTTVQMGEFMDAVERYLNQKQLWYPETP